ncbi:hypothetical protein D3C81_2335410 [compost metagenome]
MADFEGLAITAEHNLLLGEYTGKTDAMDSKPIVVPAAASFNSFLFLGIALAELLAVFGD